jgi:hypothetical protein
MKLGLQIYAIIIPSENSFIKFNISKINRAEVISLFLRLLVSKKKSLFGSFGCLLAKI